MIWLLCYIILTATPLSLPHSLSLLMPRLCAHSHMPPCATELEPLPLPEGLSALERLERLTLEGNLRGSIPQAWTGLQRLQSLCARAPWCLVLLRLARPLPACLRHSQAAATGA